MKITEIDVSFCRVKKLITYIKKYKKFGAYIEVTEKPKNRFDVSVFCPKIHIDKYGNMAVAKGELNANDW